MNQLALLDDGPRARQSDSWTSHAAAQRVAEFAGSHIDVILACLVRHGPQTIDEIAKRTPLNSVQISRRLSECDRRGLAEPTGLCRLSASGRPERVWRVRGAQG